MTKANIAINSKTTVRASSASNASEVLLLYAFVLNAEPATKNAATVNIISSKSRVCETTACADHVCSLTASVQRRDIFMQSAYFGQTCAPFVSESSLQQPSIGK